MYGDWTTIGGPAPSPGIVTLAKRLAFMSPVDQQKYIDALVERTRKGDAESKQVLTGLAQLSEVTATPQGGTKPDVAKIVASALPQMARVLVKSAVPPAALAFAVNDGLKLLTGGKVDFERQFSRTLEELFRGRLDRAAETYVKEYAKNLRNLFVQGPLDLLDTLGMALTGKKADGWLKAVLLPIPFLLNEAIGFFTRVFGGGPCEWLKKGPCTYGTLWDGRKETHGVCCNPYPSGNGVMFTEHAPGYRRFPGLAVELAAGDYVAPDAAWAAALPPLVPGQKNLPIGMNGISGALVPPGWQARIWSGALMTDRSHLLGPGTHNLAELGFNDSVAAIEVRGTWTIHDFLYGQELLLQRTGWITSWMPRPPTVHEVRALVLGDPGRPRTSLGFEGPLLSGTRMWDTRWADNLGKAGLLGHPETMAVLDTLGVPRKEQDLAAARMITGFLDRLATTPEPAPPPPPVWDSAAALRRLSAPTAAATAGRFPGPWPLRARRSFRR